MKRTRVSFGRMFLIARAITYATLFVGIVLVFLPLKLLRASQISWPASIGASQAAGIFLAGAGAVLALWGVLTLVFVGQGTPAPFDPPRQLVVSGPYRYSRNPVYIGAGIAVFGAALFYQSLAVFSYAIAFSLMAFLFVVGYEEPTLRNTFRHGYPDYCREVKRWVGRRQKRGVERSER